MENILIGVLLLFSLISSSQTRFKPCKIIISEKDSLVGTCKMDKFNEYCEFAISTNSEAVISIEPTNVQQVIFTKSLFYDSKRVIEGDSSYYLFLEPLVLGEINLYAIDETGRYFVQKDESFVYELKDEEVKNFKSGFGNYQTKNYRYLGFLKSYMNDAPLISNSIDSIESLSQEKLIQLSVDYHNIICDEYSCIVYKKEIPKLRTFLGVSIGVSKTNSYYSLLQKIEVKNSIKRGGDHLFVKLGLGIADLPYYQKADDNIIYYKPHLFGAIQYDFGTKKVRPKLGMGFSFQRDFLSNIQGGFLIDIKKDMFFINLTGSIESVFQINEHVGIYNNKLGHSVTLGLTWRLN